MLRTGRTAAYRSKALRSCTLTERKPLPTGVVPEPFQCDAEFADRPGIRTAFVLMGADYSRPLVERVCALKAASGQRNSGRSIASLKSPARLSTSSSPRSSPCAARRETAGDESRVLRCRRTPPLHQLFSEIHHAHLIRDGIADVAVQDSLPRRGREAGFFLQLPLRAGQAVFSSGTPPIGISHE